MFKKIMAACLAFTGLFSCLTGCSRKQETGQLESYNRSAGSYVQQEITIPVDGYSQDMVMLPDGRLWLAIQSKDASSAVLLTSDITRSKWEKIEPLPDKVLNSGKIWSITLSNLGELYVITYYGDGKENPYQFQPWYQAPGTVIKEVHFHGSDLEYDSFTRLFESEFVAEGTVLQSVEGGMREISLTTGEVSENKKPSDVLVQHIQKAGDTIYLTGYDSVNMYRDGEVFFPESAAEKQISNEQKANEGNSNSRITLWHSPEDYLFFTTREGLYSSVPGGCITEQLISGERTALGNPDFRAVSMVGAQDQSFYCFGETDCPKLYHYAYETGTFTESSEELTIYMLYGQGGTYAKENIEKIINQFGIAYPSVQGKLEFGIEDDSNLTQADAMAALNDRILAGDGPDILYLDGMNIQSFMDQNILMDLNSILLQTDPLVETVARCYERNGVIPAVPTAFSIPAVYGPKIVISQIHDLDSFLKAAENRDNSLTESATGILFALDMGNQLYDSCSPAWFREDGSVDKEKLAEFYRAIARLFALDQDYRFAFVDALEESVADDNMQSVTQYYTGFHGGIAAMEKKYLSFGTLNGMDDWSCTLAGDQNFEGNDVLPLNLQASGVFIPKQILGIVSGTKNQTAAENFIRFAFTPEMQIGSGYVGFPVNQAALDQLIAEDQTTTQSFGFGDVHATALWPDLDRRQMLKAWVSQLTTPASVNWVVRDVILAQVEPCCSGEITPEEAADSAIEAINLYISE